MDERRKKLIYDFICDDCYVPMKKKEMAMLLQVPKESRQELEEILNALEKEGRAFVFAPAQLEHVNTYSMDASAEQLLYDEGLRECEARLAALTDFLA